MVYKLNVPLVGGDGTRKAEVINSSGDLVIDEIHTSQGISSAAPYVLGRTFGYVSSGYAPSGVVNIIQKFPFSTDGNASDVGDLTRSTSEYPGGGSSDTHGYTAGGANPPTNIIDKFPFSSDDNATDVGDLLHNVYNGAAHSSETHGYYSGGTGGPPTSSDVIQKYSFSADGNATDVGDIVYPMVYTMGNQSETIAYVMNMTYPIAPAPTGFMEKFPFASDTDASIINNSGLQVKRIGLSAQSSDTNGYFSGGQNPVGGQPTNIIERFPFASETNQVDVGNLLQSTGWAGGTQSETHGYVTGGQGPTPPYNNRYNKIDKFSFSNDENSTDVGDLTAYLTSPANQQV